MKRHYAKTNYRRWGLALLGLFVSSSFFACAGQDDIDRTQPNRLPKAMFQGEWYMRSTVIDVPATVRSTFAGYTGPMEKIVWEIQEDQLIAYRSYEEILGSDVTKELYDKQEEHKKAYKENPIASFKIQSHFDVIRNYNSATGEQTNVISENTTDRPWHEREYIRVDWSESLINADNYTRIDGADSSGNYWVQTHETDNPDAFRVHDSEGNPINFDTLDTIRKDKDGKRTWDVNYFDMVGHVLMEPFKINYYGYKYPLCWFRGYQTDTCDSAEVKVRTAFLKVGDRNYEPVIHDETAQGKFGYFRTERYSLDEKYGLTESGRIYLANVHNIWEKAYEENEDGTIDYSRKIPLKNRTPKPIVYHLSPDFPCDMVKSSLIIGESWNNTFRRTVAIAKGYLKQTAGDSKAELAKVSKDVVPDMFKIHLNGWSQINPGSDWSCENLQYNKEEEVFQIGDLRYNTLAWIGERQIQGPLGYGPSSADPNTGEIVSGVAYHYGQSLDTYATLAVDIVRALNKDLTIDPRFSEDTVRDYISKNLNLNDPRNIDPAFGQLKVADFNTMRNVFFKPEQLKRLDYVSQLQPNGKPNLPLYKPGMKLAKRELLKGTPYEFGMVDDEVVRNLAPALLGRDIQPGDTLTEEELRTLSPVTGDASTFFALDEMRRDIASRNNIWLAEFADDSVIGLAIEMWKRFGKEKAYTEMWQYLREKIFQGVAEHEIGHTVGLRHNFSGSYDSMNYHTRWWQLREKPDAQGIGGLGGNVATFDGMLKMMAMNDAQKQGRMREYQYSSIMDYSGKFNGDFQGLGKYDEAAVLFAYGKHVEVFNSVPENTKRIMRQRYGDCAPRFESKPNIAYDDLLEVYHYSTVWQMFNQTPGLVQRRFVSWDDLGTKQRNASQQCRDFVKSGQGTAGQFAQQLDPERDVEVPYMFCSDEYVGATVSCSRWDEGADPFEIARYATDHYRNYYFFNNFKRDRVGFTSMSGFSRAKRYFSYLPMVYQHWLFDVQVYRKTQADPLLENLWTLGVYSGFNQLLDVLATPEYGRYQNNGKKWQLVSESTTPTSNPNEMVIPPGEGRAYYSNWDYSGYLLDKILETGHWLEQWAALETLTESQGTFVGVDTQGDFATYNIPYYIVFKDEITRYFESVTTEQTDFIAPRIMPNGQLTRSMNALVELNNGTQIDPETGTAVDRSQGLPIEILPVYTIRYIASIFGMLDLDFDGRYTTEFQDRQRVFRLGSGTVNEPGTGFHWETCTDPINGHKFGVIVKDSIPASEAPSVARHYIKQCQQAADVYVSTPDDYTNGLGPLTEAAEWLNRMAGIYEIIGNGKTI